MTTRWVIVGNEARSDGGFSLDDLPGTSGRLDVLLRSLKAALLVSHGVRRDSIVYLVLLGGEPRCVRVTGAEAQFLRPDERHLARTLQKALAAPRGEAAGFRELRHGWALAEGGLETLAGELGGSHRVVLDHRVPWRRGAFTDLIAHQDVTFILGDHRGLSAGSLDPLAPFVEVGLGDDALFTEDAIAIVWFLLRRSL